MPRFVWQITEQTNNASYRFVLFCLTLILLKVYKSWPTTCVKSTVTKTFVSGWQLINSGVGRLRESYTASRRFTSLFSFLLLTKQFIFLSICLCCCYFPVYKHCVSIELANSWRLELRARSISMDGQWTLSSTRWNAHRGLLSIGRPSTFTICCSRKTVTHALYVLIITNSCWPMHCNRRRRKGRKKMT